MHIIGSVIIEFIGVATGHFQNIVDVGRYRPERQSADAILEKGSAILRKMILLRIIGRLDKAVDVPLIIIAMCKNIVEQP